MLGVGIFRVTAGYLKAQIVTVPENEALKELQFCSNSSSGWWALAFHCVLGAVAFKAAMELGRGMGIRQVRMPQSLLFCRDSAFFFPFEKCSSDVESLWSSESVDFDLFFLFPLLFLLLLWKRGFLQALFYHSWWCHPNCFLNILIYFSLSFEYFTIFFFSFLIHRKLQKEYREFLCTFHPTSASNKS